LLQLAEMMECETKPTDIFHMDLVYAEIWGLSSNGKWA
jgi:hypothetical protein